MSDIEVLVELAWLFARVLPHLGVLSHNEVPPQVQVASIATLD
jgi:flagellar biosynthesis component FlhA